MCNVFKNKYKDLYQSNSTTDEVMYLLNEQINEMIANEESQSICNVKVDDVRKAFCKLNKDKNDGRKGTNSNHFIQGSHYKPASGYFVHLFAHLLPALRDS